MSRLGFRLRSVAFGTSITLISSIALVTLDVACGDSPSATPWGGEQDSGANGTKDGSGLIPGDSSSSTQDGSSTQQEAGPPVRSAISVGAAFACLLAKDRTVWCWGKNDVGQLGKDPAATPSCGAFPCTPNPVKVEGLPPIARIALGDDFGCALDSSANVWCWGNNNKGQLSTGGNPQTSFVPKQIAVDIAKIYANGAHACIITNQGFVRCWGENTCQIFGKAEPANILSGKQLILPVTSDVSLGPDAMCIVSPQNKILCWGADHNGSLGHDLDTNPAQCNGLPSDPIAKHVQSKATEIPLENVAEVRMGLGVACARQIDGQVLCWGDNSRGALGQGVPDPGPHPRAIEVPALKASAIDVRGGTPCAVVAQKLLCWGDGEYGQLDSLGAGSGCGGTGCRPLGYVIPNMSPVRELASGGSTIATIKDDLSVWMWGRNSSAETALPQSDPANKPCANGNVCVPQPKKIANVPALD